MIKKIFYVLLFVFTCFIGLNNVSAETNQFNSNTYVQHWENTFNGTEVLYGKYYYGNSTTLNIGNNATLYLAADYTGSIVPPKIYTRISLCIDTYVSPGYQVKGADNVSFNATSIDCTFPGQTSGYTGNLYFATMRNTPTVGDVNYFPMNSVIQTTVGKTPYTAAILGVEYSLNPFPTYTKEDTIIKQNDSILNSLNQITSSNNQVIYEQQQTNTKLEETKQVLEDTKQTITDDDTSESTSKATEFFEGFNTNTHGLTGIITAPITLIGNITSSSCTPLQAPLPFVNEKISLPCMSSIYSKYFGSFYDIYKIITFGIVAYWVCVRIFNLVKDFKNPEHDEIEVMDL